MDRNEDVEMGGSMATRGSEGGGRTQRGSGGWGGVVSLQMPVSSEGVVQLYYRSIGLFVKEVPRVSDILSCQLYSKEYTVVEPRKVVSGGIH